MTIQAVAALLVNSSYDGILLGTRVRCMQSHLKEVIKTVAQIIYGTTYRRVNYRIYQVQRNTTELH